MSNRFEGIDIIKSIAIFFVVIVHGYLISDYYSQVQVGLTAFILFYVRTILLTCVPLFIITTGYLSSKIELKKDYFKKIKPIFITYISISIITLIVIKLYIKPESEIINLILGILNYQGNIGYAWYIEMYIGLFLLIPFLNILYKGLKTKKEKQILLVVLAILTTVPSLINSIKIEEYALNIIPDWWTNLYPILYYYIGCYIREFKPRVNSKVNLVCIATITLLISFTYYHYMRLNDFNSVPQYYYESLPIVIISTLIFLLFYQKELNCKISKKILRIISKLTLSIYLFSYMWDMIIPTIIKIENTGLIKTVKTLIIVSPTVFLISLICSIILNFIHNKIVLKKKDKITLKNE